MKKSSFMVLSLAFILNIAVAFIAVSGASGYSAFACFPEKMNLISNIEVPTLTGSFSERNCSKIEHFNSGFNSKDEEPNKRVEETAQRSSLPFVLSEVSSVRILENIRLQSTRAVEALSERKCRSSLFVSSTEQSAVSKNKSHHSETRQNIQQRK